MVFLDAAAGLPLHPVARQALLAALDDGWADPGRLYAEGRRARMLLDGAREAVAAVIGARPDETFFAASGTAAVRSGLDGLLTARRRQGDRLVVAAVEHSSVLASGRRHDPDGSRTAVVPVDRTGRVDPDAFAASLAPGTAVAALQTANHEVGTVQPVAEVAAACAAAGVPLLCDAAQSVGRVPVDVAALEVSALVASAHKWGGPPGVGVLVVRKGTRFRPADPPDERNLPAILAAAASLQARLGEMGEEAGRLDALVTRIRAEVPRTVPDVEVVGDPVNRLPHLVTFSCLYVDGEALLLDLDRAGFAVSSGSSCTADTIRPSHVLEAMGVLSHGNVRVSLHAGVTEDDVDRFLGVLPDIVGRLRRVAGVEGL